MLNTDYISKLDKAIADIRRIDNRIGVTYGDDPKDNPQTVFTFYLVTSLDVIPSKEYILAKHYLDSQMVMENYIFSMYVHFIEYATKKCLIDIHDEPAIKEVAN